MECTWREIFFFFLQDQLQHIFAHIEDLQQVNQRVRVSDWAEGYQDPALSEDTELSAATRQQAG